MKLINENVAREINKIGLDLINVNIRDITDESGYIEAIGLRISPRHGADAADGRAVAG